MPSKRTNDSVDRILEELNMQQAQAGLRDSVTDHQVDEILRSVGILSLPDEPLPEDKLAFPEGDALDDLLQKPVSQPAPAPAQPRPYTPVQQPDPQPVQPDARTTRPPEQPLPTVDKTGTQTFSGDTTGTGIIKGFLGKMAPGGDAESLDQGKNEFKRFFGTSVAVVPDENGRLHEPGKKKRSLFGLKHAEDTGAFEPINVTMGGGRAVGQAEPEEEYYPDAELEPTPAQPARAAKKHGFFGSLFDREEETEELMIPEERAEEPSPYRPGAAVPPQQPVQTPSAAAVPVQPEPPVPPAQEETSTQEVWRSKYTRPARRAAEESGHTVEIIQGTVGYAKNHPSAPSPSGMTGTIYRKKKNTVEFTPGQKIQKVPPPQPVPQRSGEPVGEPIETPRSQTSTGYTMQIGGLDAVPVDSTQDFMAAYNAVRPQRRPAPAPVQPAAPVQMSHSLEDANVCAHAVVHARPEVQDEIEQSIVYGQYHSPQAVLADIKAMTTDLIAVTVNYYCPLQVRMTDEEYGDWYEVDNGYALDNKRAIRELLQKEQNEDMNDMADYFDGSESAKAKIVSAVWDVHEVNGELFGVIRTGLREILSPAEEQEWIDELIGQAADGFGEGLEQRPICTADGEIYVSFWNSGSDYFMENETVFRQRMSADPNLETMKLE